MKPQDRKNLIRGWPVYLLFAILVAGMAILYRQNLSIHGNEPLSKLISKNLKGTDRPSKTLDEVINQRKTWEPVLPDWQGKELPNLKFRKSNGENGTLDDYGENQIVIVIGATWYPPFKVQLHELEGIQGNEKSENPVILGITAESTESIRYFSHNNPLSFDLCSVASLPEPYCLPDGIPCLFFIDSQKRLKLAAVGLIPQAQAQAILNLPLPESLQN